MAIMREGDLESHVVLLCPTLNLYPIDQNRLENMELGARPEMKCHQPAVAATAVMLNILEPLRKVWNWASNNRAQEEQSRHDTR